MENGEILKTWKIFGSGLIRINPFGQGEIERLGIVIYLEVQEIDHQTKVL